MPVLSASRGAADKETEKESMKEEKETETVVLDEDLLKEIVHDDEKSGDPENAESRLVRLKPGADDPGSEEDKP